MILPPEASASGDEAELGRAGRVARRRVGFPATASTSIGQTAPSPEAVGPRSGAVRVSVC